MTDAPDWMKKAPASIPVQPASPKPLDVKALNETLGMAVDRMKEMNDRLERGEKLPENYQAAILESAFAALRDVAAKIRKANGT